MQLKKRTFVLSFITLVTFCNGYSQRISMNKVIDSLIFYKTISGKPCTECVKNNVDSSIYLLIERINLDKKVFVGYQDPLSSFLAPNPNYIGINSLYFLEIILRDSLKTNLEITKIKMFTKCTLISKKNKFKPLTMQDMDYLKSTYLKWYNETVKLSMQKKREIWKLKYLCKVLKFYEWI